MIKQPLTRTVQFDRPTFIDGAVVPIGEKRAFGTGFAAELVTARKAHFCDPDPAPVAAAPAAPVSATADPDATTAKPSAKKG